MPEPVMTESHSDLARTALLEITRAETVGELLGETAEDDGTITVRFASELPGYPGWAWTVSVATVDGEAPTVLEAELMPGDGALLAPDWVPWSERLADYKAAQDALEVEAGADDESDDDSDEDEDEDDDDLEADDPLGNDVLHGGDLDGVDIDDLDEDDLDGDSDELDSDADELNGDSDELDADIDNLIDEIDESSN